MTSIAANPEMITTCVLTVPPLRMLKAVLFERTRGQFPSGRVQSWV